MVTKVEEDEPADGPNHDREGGGDYPENRGEGEGLEEGLWVIEGRVEVVSREEPPVDHPEELEV